MSRADKARVEAAAAISKELLLLEAAVVRMGELAAYDPQADPRVKRSKAFLGEAIGHMLRARGLLREAVDWLGAK